MFPSCPSSFSYFFVGCVSGLTCTSGAAFTPRLLSMASLSLSLIAWVLVELRGLVVVWLVKSKCCGVPSHRSGFTHSSFQSSRFDRFGPTTSCQLRPQRWRRRNFWLCRSSSLTETWWLVAFMLLCRVPEGFPARAGDRQKCVSFPERSPKSKLVFLVFSVRSRDFSCVSRL